MGLKIHPELWTVAKIQPQSWKIGFAWRSEADVNYRLGVISLCQKSRQPVRVGI